MTAAEVVLLCWGITWTVVTSWCPDQYTLSRAYHWARARHRARTQARRDQRDSQHMPQPGHEPPSGPRTHGKR